MKSPTKAPTKAPSKSPAGRPSKPPSRPAPYRPVPERTISQARTGVLSVGSDARPFVNLSRYGARALGGALAAVWPDQVADGSPVAPVQFMPHLLTYQPSVLDYRETRRGRSVVLGPWEDPFVPPLVVAPLPTFLPDPPPMIEGAPAPVPVRQLREKAEALGINSSARPEVRGPLQVRLVDHGQGVVEISIREPEVRKALAPQMIMNLQRRYREAKGGWFAYYQAVNRAITATYGAYTEVMDFVDAVAWNTYARLPSGEVVPAMAVTRGNEAAALLGALRGEYRVDLGGAIADYAIAQTMDYVIGQVSRHAQRSLNAAGWTGAGIGTLTGAMTRADNFNQWLSERESYVLSESDWSPRDYAAGLWDAW